MTSSFFVQDDDAEGEKLPAGRFFRHENSLRKGVTGRLKNKRNARPGRLTRGGADQSLPAAGRRKQGGRGDDLPVHSVGVNAEHKLAAVFAVLKRRHSLRDLLEIRLFAHLDMQCGVSPCAESRKAFRRVDGEGRWISFFSSQRLRPVTMTISSFTKMSRY